MSTDTITITDNRTGKTYEIPIEHEAIRALDLRQVKRQPSSKTKKRSQATPRRAYASRLNS